MQIPEEVRKCVVYVGYKPELGDVIFGGTAFFVSRNIEKFSYKLFYLVTARHILQKIQDTKSFDGIIYLRINLFNGDAATYETHISQWLYHPDESEVDVAVIPHFQLEFTNFDVLTIPIEMFANETVRQQQSIGIGDEIFLTGMFNNHQGRKRNIPIIRIGNIAAMPEEKVFTGFGIIDAYLVEARSIGGISGSPVFVYIEHLRNNTLTDSSKFYLLGLMHGHFDVKTAMNDVIDEGIMEREIVNMGIAIVVPSDKILEVVSQPAIRQMDIETENAFQELSISMPELVNTNLTAP